MTHLSIQVADAPPTAVPPLYAEFLDLARRVADLHETPPQRLARVAEEIDAAGTYRLTGEELIAGAKVAWRNHARCNGRMHWRSLRVNDFRDRSSVDEVFEGLVEHVHGSTNNGALRAVLSVFGQGPDTPIVLNPQLVRYAGYLMPDGSVLGDPLHVRLTKLALELGWRAPGTEFDVLPLIIRDQQGALHVRQLPPEEVLEVRISHPDYPKIGDLGLRWHANPAISDKVLSIGGIDHPLAPFSGWYVSSEIGARNLGDVARYNKLRAVAEAIGLDASRDSTFWKDRAVVELTVAVHHSFESAGVHVVDHHRAAGQFLTHVKREAEAGRPTPTDWSWVNPPISASTTPTFHHTFDAPDLTIRPNFVARADDSPEGCPLHRG